MKELILTGKASHSAGGSTPISVSVDLQNVDLHKDGSIHFVRYGAQADTPLSEISVRSLIRNILFRIDQVHTLTEPITNNNLRRQAYEAQAHLLMCANAVIFEVQELSEELAVRFGV